MNRFAPVTFAASLLAAACTAGAWQGWGLGQDAARDRQAANDARSEEPVTPDELYAYSGSGADINHGYYGWSYLFTSPVAAPLVAAHEAVRNDQQ